MFLNIDHNIPYFCFYRMSQSRAEIQKRYRKSKKKESGNYITKGAKENERHMPIDLLSKSEKAEKGRTEILKRNKHYIYMKKYQKEKLLNSAKITGLVCKQNRETKLC